MLMYSNCIAITEAVGYGAVEIYCALYWQVFFLNYFAHAISVKVR